ncbi:hypothetical protein DPMN_187768 [Dreissena polymorpha]|uniref:Uncharacterized protein n=1 Tax=Dreissena polymorpha TaxID=45954 RepID=A0A9D4DNY2_DREPO|nr:hypothetical protein DPMN_187768 [Dreissena polymorpha]
MWDVWTWRLSIEKEYLCGTSGPGGCSSRDSISVGHLNFEVVLLERVFLWDL